VSESKYAVKVDSLFSQFGAHRRRSLKHTPRKLASPDDPRFKSDVDSHSLTNGGAVSRKRKALLAVDQSDANQIGVKSKLPKKTKATKNKSSMQQKSDTSQNDRFLQSPEANLPKPQSTSRPSKRICLDNEVTLDTEMPVAPASASCDVGGIGIRTRRASRRLKLPNIGPVCWSSCSEDTVDLVKSVCRQWDTHVENRAHAPFSHLIMETEKRTMKLLHGIARGAWVLHPSWLNHSIETDGWAPESKHEWKVDGLLRSRAAHKSGQTPLLHGLRVFFANSLESDEANYNISQLQLLALDAGATVSDTPDGVDMLIGTKPIRDQEVVHPKWLIESIYLYEPQDRGDFPVI
jgi:hypothetical protein